ncbi:MAG: TonB-dependent receptor [Cellulomonas sp.]|nr:TonB-dependent receptor [Cellulomonas sp.]
MNAKQLLVAATLGTGALVVTHLVDPTVARAQSTTAGAIQGVVTDSKTGEKLAGVTITVASPALQGTQTEITDDNGEYKISPLPPGEYLVTFYYLEATVERSGISVGVNKTTPVYQKLSSDPKAGEVVQIQDSAPTIDPTTTTQGITIDKNYIKNIPLPGRTFEAALGAAAGSQNDGVGVSFSGSSSLENQYYVDGVNTTGLTFGTVGSPVINDFVEEIEVITGGYNAEFGRATGGVVNVVTKSGSNEIKGSIFGTYQPGQLTHAVERTPSNAASIDAKADNGYRADFGFEIGGPIVKDKLWFFVGFVPQFSRIDITRTTKRRTDCHIVNPDGSVSGCDPMANRNGVYDVDPQTGFFITENIDSEIRTAKTNAYNAIGKINYALNPENQGQLSFQALPATVESPAIYGPATSGTKGKQLTTDVSGKWTSKFNDNKTEIEAIAGWHRDYVKTDPFDPTSVNTPLQVLFNSNLGTLGPNFGESAATNAACRDNENPTSTDDKFPLIQNCPIDSVPYVIGGPGSITDDKEQRFAGKVNITQRVKAAGSHELKAGIDVENNLRDKARLYSGGAFIQNFLGQSNQVVVDRFVQLLGLKGSPQTDNPDPRFSDTCTTPDPKGNSGVGGGGTLTYLCDYLGAGDAGSKVKGNTFNWAVYLRDSWQIQPNLTLNVGMRYEEQRLRYADSLANKRDPLTQEQLGKNAMVLNGMFAPRIGLLYDWTKEGRSKIYVNYGRYFESIPMDINDRSFGGETTFRQTFGTAAATCAPQVDGTTAGADPKIGGLNGQSCLTTSSAPSTSQLIGASGTLVAPGIKAQYLDEIIGGAEYEIIDDLKIGISYQNRQLGRVIEDVSTDGASTYLIANPGEWSKDEETKLEQRIMNTDSDTEHQRLTNQLQLFRGIRGFDKPTRTYNALQFTATRRFSKKLYVQGSYTFSKTQGNYPGLISYDNGQIDPNISSQYDLIELTANRYGPLPQDRPHYIKLDGYYTFDLKKAGSFTTGIRLRALSGIPENALAGHYLYGANESFLLPRGQIGRTDFEHGLDVHLGYAKNLRKNTNLEIYADLYNIYNRQGSFGVDDTYAPQNTRGGVQNANPVSGGTYEDLIWVKAINRDGGERQDPINRNPNYRNTNRRYAPGYVQFGMRLTF